jgi:hypothetical protein
MGKGADMPEDDHCQVQRECLDRFAKIESDTRKIPDIAECVERILEEQRQMNGTVLKHNLVLMGEEGVPGLVTKHDALAKAVSKLRPKVVALWVLFGIILTGMGFLANHLFNLSRIMGTGG